jgi:hypothetical protein
VNSPEPTVITTLSPQLDVRRLEVSASPMLDLVELRFREPDGTVAAEYLDRTQARKLAELLEEKAEELDEEWKDVEVVESAPAREEAGADSRGAGTSLGRDGS